ncbi:unnamed protein product, partial [Ixodes hexagonus]
GGILANSLAIATDAAHLLTDFASFMISLFSLWMGGRPATKRLSFGWYRAEVIGALTSVIMIWAVTGVLVYMAILRMINREYNIQADIMLISATVGVIVNIIMGLALQIHPPSAFGHSHTSEESTRPAEITSTEPFVPRHHALDVDSPAHSPEMLGADWKPFAHSLSEPTQPGESYRGQDSAVSAVTQPPLSPTPGSSWNSSIRAREAVVPWSEQDTALVPWSGQAAPQTTEATEPFDATDQDSIKLASDEIETALAEREQRAQPDASAPDEKPLAPAARAAPASIDVKLKSPEPKPSAQYLSGPVSDVQPSASGMPSSQRRRFEGPRRAILVEDGYCSRGELGPSLPTTDPAMTPAESSGAETSPDKHKGVMNLNVRAAFIHVLGDLIQSVGVLLAAIIIYFCPSCGMVDPICTLMFSVIVLVTTLAILKEALNVLMEGIPRSVDYRQVRAMLLSVRGVARVHDLHIWSLSLDKLAVSAHVVLIPGADAMEVRRNASRTIRRSFDVFKLTLQMEEYEEGIRHHCRQCIEPS